MYELITLQGPSFANSFELPDIVIEPTELKDDYSVASTLSVTNIQYDYTGDYICRLEKMHAVNTSVYVYAEGNVSYEPRREKKNGFRGFHSGLTQTDLYSHRSRLEA